MQQPGFSLPFPEINSSFVGTLLVVLMYAAIYLKGYASIWFNLSGGGIVIAISLMPGILTWTLQWVRSNVPIAAQWAAFAKVIDQSIGLSPYPIGLAHATPMDEVFPPAPLVLAVTGRVLLESIFAAKPVASLGSHSMRAYPGVTALETPEDLPAVLVDVLAGCARTASRDEARVLLQHLHATSYSASLWDPVAQPHYGTEAHIEALTIAFKSVLVDRMRPPIGELHAFGLV